MFYCQDHRPGAVEDNPDEPVTEIAKILAKMWKKATSAEKKPYEKDAQKAKAKYEQEMKKYKEDKKKSESGSSDSESGSASEEK